MSQDLRERIDDERQREWAEEVRREQIEQERRQREEADKGMKPHELL